VSLAPFVPITVRALPEVRFRHRHDHFQSRTRKSKTARNGCLVAASVKKPRRHVTDVEGQFRRRKNVLYLFSLIDKVQPELQLRGRRIPRIDDLENGFGIEVVVSIQEEMMLPVLAAKPVLKAAPCLPFVARRQARTLLPQDSMIPGDSSVEASSTTTTSTSGTVLSQRAVDRAVEKARTIYNWKYRHIIGNTGV
jgi:hypothetical protein